MPLQPSYAARLEFSFYGEHSMDSGSTVQRSSSTWESCCHCYGGGQPPCDTTWDWMSGNDQPPPPPAMHSKNARRQTTRDPSEPQRVAEAFAVMADAGTVLPASELGELLFLVTRMSYPPRQYQNIARELCPAYRSEGLDAATVQALVRRLREDEYM